MLAPISTLSQPCWRGGEFVFDIFFLGRHGGQVGCFDDRCLKNATRVLRQTPAIDHTVAKGRLEQLVDPLEGLEKRFQFRMCLRCYTVPRPPDEL